MRRPRGQREAGIDDVSRVGDGGRVVRVREGVVVRARAVHLKFNKMRWAVAPRRCAGGSGWMEARER